MWQTIRRPLIIGVAVGLVLGLLLGMLLFWNVWPVEYEGVYPWHMFPDERAQYVTLVADSYRLDNDYERVAGLLSRWPADLRQQAFEDAIKKSEVEGRPDETLAVRDLAMALQISEEPLAAPAPPAGPLDRFLKLFLVFFAVLLAGVLAWIAIRLLLRRRAAQATTRPPAVTEAVGEIDETRLARGTSDLGHWTTRYNSGEDAYDESFPVETAAGEYLGECGVGISEILPGGEPDKVTAFEVWLFDKSDIRTVTKVLMSEYAFHDQALRDKLSSKGDAVLAEVGVPFTLETSGLKVEANVTELQYDEAVASAGGAFLRLTVDLAAIVKAEAGVAEPPQ